MFYISGLSPRFAFNIRIELKWSFMYRSAVKTTHLRTHSLTHVWCCKILWYFTAWKNS